MTRTLYFSKISLNSQEVYELEDNYEFRFKLTNDIFYMLKHDSSYVDSYIYTDDDNNEHTGNIIYNLSIKNKDDSGIYGVIYRNSNVFVKQKDENGELKSLPVDNTEDVEFYYDVLHEYIAFVTRQKFGKNMVNDAFAGLLNECAKKEGYTYSFYVESYNEGMSIEEIKSEIKSEKNIKELIITYRPANPDEAIINTVKGAKQSELIRESNATERSIIYKAKGKMGIDGAATVIQEDLNRLAELNEDIPIEEMTKRGYAIVRSVNDKGEVKSTTDSKPFIRRIKDCEDFVGEAKKGIMQILRKVVR